MDGSGRAGLTRRWLLVNRFTVCVGALLIVALGLASAAQAGHCGPYGGYGYNGTGYGPYGYAAAGPYGYGTPVYSPYSSSYYGAAYPNGYYRPNGYYDPYAYERSRRRRARRTAAVVIGLGILAATLANRR
jgi:hypothetical protein